MNHGHSRESAPLMLFHFPMPDVLLARSVTLVYLGFFGVACLLSALATMFILKTQQAVGMDKPDARRKLHERPVSRLGVLGHDSS